MGQSQPCAGKRNQLGLLRGAWDGFVRNFLGVWRRLSGGHLRAKEEGGVTEESEFHIWAAELKDSF